MRRLETKQEFSSSTVQFVQNSSVGRKWLLEVCDFLLLLNVGHEEMNLKWHKDITRHSKQKQQQLSGGDDGGCCDE